MEPSRVELEPRLVERAEGALDRAIEPTREARRGISEDTLLQAVPWVLVLVGLAAWELSARMEWISPMFYPAPSAILGALGEMVRSGLLAASLGASFTRMLLGFVCGGGVGLLLGLCMGWSRRLRLMLDPLVAIAHPVPRLAMLPLILLLFGIGETSRVLVIAMSCFFPMLLNAIAGVRQIEPVHFEVARNFGANRRQILTHVVLPGSVPSVMVGTRLSLISALKTTLGIELITSDRGLGHLIWFAWETFNPSLLYASLVVIATLGVSMNSILKWLVARAQPGGRAVAT